MMSIVSNTGRHLARGVIKACLELARILPRRSPSSASRSLGGGGREDLGKYGIEFRDRQTSMWEAAGEAVAKIQ